MRWLPKSEGREGGNSFQGWASNGTTSCGLSECPIHHQLSHTMLPWSSDVSQCKIRRPCVEATRFTADHILHCLYINGERKWWAREHSVMMAVWRQHISTGVMPTRYVMCSQLLTNVLLLFIFLDAEGEGMDLDSSTIMTNNPLVNTTSSPWLYALLA